MPTESSHAVFLSYASQDAEAAQKIAEALRAASIEVFLDQSELRGGDVWDQKIRRQIHNFGRAVLWPSLAERKLAGNRKESCEGVLWTNLIIGLFSRT